jgi:hypothetical protein
MLSERDVTGIGLQIVATFLTALAYVLQKKAHIDVTSTAALGKRSVMTHKLWVIGFLLMVAVAGIDVYSFSLLDQTKQAAFGAVTLAWNTVLASVFLKESFTILDLFSVGIIMCGTVVGLSGAAAESTDFTFAEILELLHDDLVYAYSSIMSVFILVVAFFVERTSRRPRSQWSAKESRTFALLSPILGGLFMGFTGYGAKAIATVIFAGEWSVFASPPLYGYLLMTGVAVLCQVRYLNKGLQYFDALQVVPIFQSSIIFSNSIAGIVYYHDMRTAPAWKILIFALGGTMCIFGISLLLLKAKKPKGEGRAIGQSQRVLPHATTAALVKSVSGNAIVTGEVGGGMGGGGAGGGVGGGLGSTSLHISSAAAGKLPIQGGVGGGIGGAGATPGTPLLSSVRGRGLSVPRRSISLPPSSSSGGERGGEGDTVPLAASASAGDAAAVDARRRKSRAAAADGEGGEGGEGGNGESGSGGGGDGGGTGGGSGDNDDDDDDGDGVGGSGIARTRSTTSTASKLAHGLGQLSHLGHHHKPLIDILDKRVVDAAVDWPEGPYGNDNRGAGGGVAVSVDEGMGGRAKARSGSSSLVDSVNVAPEKWYDMEVSSAVRMVWRRVTSGRYAMM